MYVTEIWWFEINQTKERKFIDVEESTSRISTSPHFPTTTHTQPETHRKHVPCCAGKVFHELEKLCGPAADNLISGALIAQKVDFN